jgi:hypothetical protein
MTKEERNIELTRLIIEAWRIGIEMFKYMPHFFISDLDASRIRASTMPSKRRYVKKASKK